MNILIDPGHRNNEYDYGATGNGQKESALALAISKKLKVALEKRNIICYLSRESENETISVSARPKKALALKCDLLVSIHINAASAITANGIEVLYKTESVLAEQICNAMCSATRATNRGAKLRTDLGVLNGFGSSVLIECGFINNPTECKKLATEEYQDKLVQAITDVIVRKYKITVEEGYKVETTKINLNGVVKDVSTIKISGNNYIKLQDLKDSKIDIGYDGMPIVKVKG